MTDTPPDQPKGSRGQLGPAPPRWAPVLPGPASRMLRGLGVALLVAGVACVTSASVYLHFHQVTCPYRHQDLYDHDPCRVNGDKKACIGDSTLFLVAGTLALLTSRFRNRFLLLLTSVVGVLAVAAGVAIPVMGGTLLIPQALDDLGLSTAPPWYGKSQLAAAGVMMTFAISGFILSLWTEILVLRHLVSLSSCRKRFPRCWTWCFDEVKQVSEYSVLTIPVGPGEDLEPLLQVANASDHVKDMA